MRRFNALIILDDVLMLQKLHHFNFVVEEFAQELLGDVILRDDFNGHHRFMGLGEGELKRHVRKVQANFNGKM